jgi:hypothetical protein
MKNAIANIRIWDVVRLVPGRTYHPTVYLSYFQVVVKLKL